MLNFHFYLAQPLAIHFHWVYMRGRLPISRKGLPVKQQKAVSISLLSINVTPIITQNPNEIAIFMATARVPCVCMPCFSLSHYNVYSHLFSWPEFWLKEEWERITGHQWKQNGHRLSIVGRFRTKKIVWSNWYFMPCQWFAIYLNKRIRMSVCMCACMCKMAPWPPHIYNRMPKKCGRVSRNNPSNFFATGCDRFDFLYLASPFFWCAVFGTSNGKSLVTRERQNCAAEHAVESLVWNNENYVKHANGYGK